MQNKNLHSNEELIQKENKEYNKLNKKLEQTEGMENQIKINFGGRILEENEPLKKYDHSKDDLTPLTKETKRHLFGINKK